MAQKVTHLPSLEGQERTNEILEKIAASAAATASASAAPEFLDRTFEAILDGYSNTTETFYLWLAQARGTEEDGYKLLERWFTMLSHKIAGKIYTVQGHAAGAGSDSAMTAEDDLKPLGKAALATDTKDAEDWAEEHPLTWYVRFNGIHKEDGTMDVKAIEGDTAFDITGELAPVYTASMALWRKETRDASYIRKSWTSTRQAGFRPYAGDVDKTGKKRALTWHSTFGGGYDSTNAKLTSGAGTKTACYKSATTGITAARKWGQYEGLWGDTDSYWLLDMWQLRHQTKENSGYLEGCTGYNVQKQVAKAEESVTRVLLAESDFTAFLAGSVVSVGEPGAETNIDRGQASMYKTVNQATITSIVKVVDSGVTYTALNLDVSAPFTTTAESRVSSMPWTPGNTEIVPGHKDGCMGSLTDGKHPCRVAGIEVLDGAYAVGLDPLYNVTEDESNTTVSYAVHECKDPTKQAGSIGAGYTDTGISLSKLTKNQWIYPKEFVQNEKDILFPEGAFGGSSTTYYRSGFYVSGTAGVRCPYRFCALSHGGNAGLAGESGNNSPSAAPWYSRPRLSGSGGSRGEWRP